MTTYINMYIIIIIIIKVSITTPDTNGTDQCKVTASWQADQTNSPVFPPSSGL